MTTDTALIEKREELKRRLAAGEYKTLVDIFLAWTNRVIQKITRRSKLLPLWFIMVILSLAFSFIIYGTIYLSGDMTTMLNIANAFALGYGLSVLLLLILPSVFTIIGLILINQYIGRIFVLWHDDVLDATESEVSLNDFEDWLGKVGNQRLQFLITIVIGPLSGLYTVTQLGMFVGYGLALIVIFLHILGANLMYQFFMVILLSARLRLYDLKLFAADPSNSELLSRLSSVLSFIIYFVSAFAAYLTFIGTSIGLLAGIAAVLFLWLPLIAVFILNHIGLSSIIRRAKWKTLNEIQAKVEKLQAAKNFEDKETMEAINRLMDYHDRVKATRNSALDLNATLHFINSLLLPLLAFLLGNLDKVLALFARKP